MGSCLGVACVSGADGNASAQAEGTRPSTTGRGRISSIISRTPPPSFGVSSVYRVLLLLGEGGTGQTWLCQDMKTARRVAIKFIPRPLAKVLVPMVSQEIQLQAQLSEGHLGLVRVESAVLSRSHLGLVMEYVDGGTLTNYVTKRASNRSERGGLYLVEDEARYFFRQLVSAVEYLHKSHVAHRDLKMCNVVLTERRPPTLKLCDFGFAKGWDESSFMNTRIGTPVYMSPQLIASKSEGKAYSATAADVWACGVMLFAMMLGHFPYDHVGHPDPNSSGAHVEVMNEQLKAFDGDWQQTPRVAPHIALLSDDCRDLLGKMLHKDEARRITIAQIRKHPWFTTILPPYLDEALVEWEERQARLSKVMEAATEQQLKRRNKTVHDLILLAGKSYSPPVSPSAETPQRSHNTITSVFEGVVEESSGSVNSATHPGTAVTAAAGTTAAAENGGHAKSPFVTCSTAKRTISSMDTEEEIIIIDLAAVAIRTKSDGVMLLSAVDDQEVAADRGSGGIDSDDMDAATSALSRSGDGSGVMSAPYAAVSKEAAALNGNQGTVMAESGEIESMTDKGHVVVGATAVTLTEGTFTAAASTAAANSKVSDASDDVTVAVLAHNVVAATSPAPPVDAVDVVKEHEGGCISSFSNVCGAVLAVHASSPTTNCSVAVAACTSKVQLEMLDKASHCSTVCDIAPPLQPVDSCQEEASQ